MRHAAVYSILSFGAVSVRFVAGYVSENITSACRQLSRPIFTFYFTLKSGGLQVALPGQHIAWFAIYNKMQTQAMWQTAGHQQLP